MNITDFHTHDFPIKIAEKAISKLSAASHTIPFTNGTSDGLLASMTESGISRSVVLPVATNPEKVPSINSSSAQNRTKQIERFGCMHPDYDDWYNELTRVRELGLKGIKIHPVYQHTDIDDIRFLRILNRAAELGLIVVTHSGYDIGFPGEKQSTPEKVCRAIQSIGPMKLVLAHLGGWKLWEQAVQNLSGTGVYIDTSFSIGTLSPTENHPYSPEELQMLTAERATEIIHLYGTDHVLFGTDSPWSSQKTSLDLIRSCSFSSDELTRILSQNAELLLSSK